MAKDSGPGSGTSVLVRNLRYETSPQRVRRAFEKFGEIRDVYLPLDFSTKRPRGFGFVEFLDERDAMNAIQEMNHTELDGNEITVIMAQDRRKSPETMRRFCDTQRRVDDSGNNQYRGPGGRHRRRSYSRSQSRSCGSYDQDHHRRRRGRTRSRSRSYSYRRRRSPSYREKGRERDRGDRDRERDRGDRDRDRDRGDRYEYRKSSRYHYSNGGGGNNGAYSGGTRRNHSNSNPSYAANGTNAPPSAKPVSETIDGPDTARSPSR